MASFQKFRQIMHQAQLDRCKETFKFDFLHSVQWLFVILLGQHVGIYEVSFMHPGHCVTRYISKCKLQRLPLHDCQHRMGDPWRYFNTEKNTDPDSSRKEDNSSPVTQDY